MQPFCEKESSEIVGVRVAESSADSADSYINFLLDSQNLVMLPYPKNIKQRHKKMSDLEKLEILQNTKNIAMLGISADTSKASNEVARYLISQGYNILPIHPKHSKILGRKAHKNLQDVFDKNSAIDILNIFRKSEALEGIAKEIVALKNKPKCVWIQLGLQSPRAREIIQSAGIAYIEDLCIELEHRRLI